MGRKLLNGIIVLLAAFICPLSIIVGIGGSSLLFNQAPSEVEVRVGSPNIALEENPFVITILISNQADTTQRLNSIDLVLNDLDALDVVNSTPPFSESSDEFGFKTYWFDSEIQPGESLEVSLETVARKTGTYQFRVDVCINGPMSCLSYETEIDVR